MPRRLAPRLRTTLLALFAIAVLPALVVILRSAWTSSNESVEQTSHETLEDASDAARHLGGSIDEARHVLHRLATEPAVQQADASACAPLLSDFLPLHPTFRNIGLIGADGHLVCSARPPATSVDFSSSPLLGEALATHALILREFPAGSVTSRPILACILAVHDADGKPIGLLFATLEFRALAGLSIGTRLPPGSTVTLLDSRGTVIVREPGPSHWRGRSIADTALWSHLRSGALDGHADVADLDGTPRLFGFARIPPKRARADAYLLVGVPLETATAPPRARMLFELAGLAAALLLLCGIAWFGIEAFVLRSVRSMCDAAVELAAGRSGVRRAATPGARELTQLGEAFDQMVEMLERSLGETRGALGVVRKSQSRLQTLSRALLDSQEQERSQLARELHDEVGQALTAATLNLDALRGSACDAETGRRVSAALDVVKQALDQVRDLSLDLHPSILDDLGLTPALRWYLKRQSERSGVAMNVEEKGLDKRLPRPIETACFRIAQEAVNNALRHARPRRIDVTVERHDDEAELVVRDDGAGFEVEAARERARQSQSLGLIGMEERAELLGGRLEVEARPGAGTEVRAHLPIETALPVQAVA